MFISIGDERYDFQKAQIKPIETGIQNLFARFNKMTLGELVSQKKYEHLKALTLSDYTHLLDQPTGEALMDLKESGDVFYKKFLNNYGDLTYFRFTVGGNEQLLSKKGVYNIIVDDQLVFSGVCARSFRERFNQHIGNISAKGCYRDGTATHCHINARLYEVFDKAKVMFTICPLTDSKEMNHLKNSIIKRFEPEWNIKSNKELSSYLKHYETT